MMHTKTMAAWTERDGKMPKFYHMVNQCRLQLEKEFIVLGEEAEARRKGIVLCPDCEKVMKHDNA